MTWERTIKKDGKTYKYDITTHYNKEKGYSEQTSKPVAKSAVKTNDKNKKVTTEGNVKKKTKK